MPAIRRPIMNAATHDYVRMTVYVAPFIALIPPNNSYNVATVLGPTDDTHHRVLFHRLEGQRQATSIRKRGASSTRASARHRSR